MKRCEPPRLPAGSVSPRGTGTWLDLPGLEFIECPDASAGMGATLANGVAACDDWRGLLVVLGDMPWVRPATYRSLFGASRVAERK